MLPVQFNQQNWQGYHSQQAQQNEKAQSQVNESYYFLLYPAIFGGIAPL
jgi:hypothetical protein